VIKIYQGLLRTEEKQQKWKKENSHVLLLLLLSLLSCQTSCVSGVLDRDSANGQNPQNKNAKAKTQRHKSKSKKAGDQKKRQ